MKKLFIQTNEAGLHPLSFSLRVQSGKRYIKQEAFFTDEEGRVRPPTDHVNSRETVEIFP